MADPGEGAGGAPPFIFRPTPPPPPPALFQGLDPALVCIQINGGCLVGQLTNQ